jgi:XTP/dITP diphosphohydrolase/ATP diphosphatase
MASEAGYFSIGNVAAGLNRKLVRRHPHVFGEVDAPDADAVLRNWEQIKQQEKREHGERERKDREREGNSAAVPSERLAIASGLDDIPRSMPATLEAGKLGSRAAKVGFDWPTAGGLFDKLQEEIAELRAELNQPSAAHHSRVEEELGDLLFTTVNLARHLKVDAESALRAANAKFRVRFRAMEVAAGGFDALAALGPAELDMLWKHAKLEAQLDANLAPEAP